MTLEEINELKNNIDSLLDEDFDDVIYRVAQYTEDIRGGVIPVETLPVHFQWELHDFVAGKLRRQIRFLHTPSPEPTTEPVMNIQSISVPCLGENSADKGLINGEGLLGKVIFESTTYLFARMKTMQHLKNHYSCCLWLPDCNDSTSAGSNVENEKNNEEEEDEYDDILDVY